MKKRVVVFVLTMLVMCFGILLAACGGTHTKKTVSGVKVQTEPAKTEYLKDEPFDISGGKISVSYSDGSTETIDMTSEMYEQADTASYGEKKLTLTFLIGEDTYTLTIGYKVIFSTTSEAFVKLSDALPMLNAVSTDDAADIIAALAAYAALNETDKKYLDAERPQVYEKVVRLEERVLPEYRELAKARAEEYCELMNVSNYTSDNLAAINSYVQMFVTEDLDSLGKVDAEEKKLYADLENVPRRTDDPAYTLAEHKQNSASALKALLSVDVYEVKNNGITGSLIETKTIDYAADKEYAAQIEALLNPLLNAGDAAGVDEAYRGAVTGIRELYLQAFAREAEHNLLSLLDGWKGTMKEQLDRWDGDIIALTGQFSEINVDYLDDNRWWIPAPYRLDVLTGSIADKLAGAASIKQINEYYAVYAYEVLRAAMQRNIEMFYAIERNLNSVYDPSDVLYWNEIAAYWGASAAQSFVYDGIVDEYKGQIYGTGDDNPYRFAPKLYKKGECGTTIVDLVAKYETILSAIIPPPKRVEKVEIGKQPDRIVYETGDTFSVSGGQILVTYNNTLTETIEMTDEMYNAADIDMTTGGSKSVTLTFTVNGEEQTLTLYYSVISNAAFSDLIEKIEGLPSASAAADEHIAAVKECLALYAQLNEDQRNDFAKDYASSEQKLADVQKALTPLYAREGSAEVEFAWETMNYYDYSKENRALLQEKFDGLQSALAAAETFAAADTLFAAYKTEIAGIPTLSGTIADLAAFKANSKRSAERIADVRLYKVIGNGPAASVIELQTVSLKDAAEVAAALNKLRAALDSATDIAGVSKAYKDGVREVYDAVVAAYRVNAEENVKTVVNAMRDTVKEIWERDGFFGDENLPVDYMTDAWEYLWWTPEQFRVSTVYAKITVAAAGTKGDVFSNYEASYREILRAVLYKNLYTVFQYNLRLDAAIDGYRWSVLSAFNGAAGSNTFPYDGTIEEYKGAIINVEFRLWLWGFKPGEKQTTVAGLMEKYNYDMNNLLLPEA